MSSRNSNQPGLSGPYGVGETAEKALRATLGVAASMLLLTLVAITCVDVVGRYFLNAPLAGGFELTEVLLVALVFTALPLTTERAEHVDVDVVTSMFRDGVQRLISALAGLFSAAVLVTVAWRLFTHSAEAAHDGSITNALELPLAPFGNLAGIACAVSAVIALIRGFVPLSSHSVAEAQAGVKESGS